MAMLITGNDVGTGLLQPPEDDDDTSYSNGDMGLQARALYDYQAGKFYVQ